jgi:predicted MFS family arabinose efflux permease
LTYHYICIGVIRQYKNKTPAASEMAIRNRVPSGGSAYPMRRSWLVVLLCGSLVMALSMGVRQVSGLFLRPVAVDIGLTREAFGIAVALQNLVWGLTQPVAGLFADRYGARPVVLACGLLYLAGLASAAMAPNAALFAFGLGVLGGLGQSGTAFAVVLAVIGRAAPAERRSVALGLGSTAGSVGMFVLVPMTSALLDVLDWRSAMLILSALVAVTALLAWPLKESGLANDGTAGAPAGIAAATAAGDRDYWLLNLGFAVCGFQLAFIATYLPVILIDHGFDLATGATVLAAIGAFNILGTYLAGVAGGRWLKTRVLAALYLARAAVIALFLLVPLSRPSAIVIGAMIGLLWTGTVPLTNGLVADLWGRRNLGFLFGIVYVGHQIGAFVGAWAGGLVFDRTGSFDLMWGAAIAAGVAAAVCHLLLDETSRLLALAEKTPIPLG